jgi:hypothetical protein
MLRRRSRFESLYKSTEFQKLSAAERADFISAETEAFRLERIFNRQEQELKAQAEEARQSRKMRVRELRVRSIEIYFRTILTSILVLVLAVTIFVGLVKGVPAGDLTQYLTPISGLAGIAIGYFFGRGTEGKPALPSDDTDNAAEPGGGDEPET